MPHRTSVKIEDRLHRNIQHFRAELLKQDLDVSYTEGLNMLASAGASLYGFSDGRDGRLLTPNELQRVRREVAEMRLPGRSGRRGWPVGQQKQQKELGEP